MPPIARLVPAAAVVVLLAAGCGDNLDEPPAAAPDTPGAAASSPSASPAASTPAAREPHILVVAATGTAPVTSLTYALDDKSTKVGPLKLPWRLSIDVPSDGLRHEWSVKLTHGKGDVEVRAIFNGKVVGTTRGSTSGTGTASTGGSVLG
jgi:hypothetical protein